MRYSVSDWAQLVYAQGVPVHQVAKKYKVSVAVVRERLYKAGHPMLREWRRQFDPASHLFDDGQIRKIYRKRQDGASWKQLAEEYGTNSNKLRGVMRYQCLRRGWSWPININQKAQNESD